MIIYGIKLKCELPFQVTTLKEPKLEQLSKVLYKWFTATTSKGNLWLGVRQFQTQVFLGWNEKCDKCTFFEDNNKNYL